MIHEGQILEKAVRTSGVSIAFIATKIKYSRRHIYNLFNNEVIPVDVFVQIGVIINHDFSSELKKIKTFKRSIVTENEHEIDYWKNKYVDILEKYNELLEKHKKRNT